jgi:hypothetical protein
MGRFGAKIFETKRPALHTTSVKNLRGKLAF